MESRQPGGVHPTACVLAIFADASRRPVYISNIPFSNSPNDAQSLSVQRRQNGHYVPSLYKGWKAKIKTGFVK